MYSLGRVTAVSGSQMTVEADEPLANSIRIGAMVKTRSVDHEVVGTIASVEVEGGPPSRSTFVVDLLGEFVDKDAAGGRTTLDFQERKSTRLNSSHITNSYAVYCLNKEAP